MIKRLVVSTFLGLLFIQAAYSQEEKYIGLFVYNFTKYFDWPESAKSGDFIVEIIGHQSVFDELTKITHGKKIGNQNIVIKNLNNIQEMSNHSHMVFVGHWQSRFLADVLKKISEQPVLVISEMEGLLDKGSDINFVIRDGTIKFEMKTTNVSTRQIKIDPRIRELAYRVVD
jgi:hypothetical protein